MSEATERAAFEAAWLEYLPGADLAMDRQSGSSAWVARADLHTRDDRLTYCERRTRDAYFGWNAARASLAEGKAEPVHPRIKDTPYGPAILLDDLRDAERYRWLKANAYIELECDSPRVDGWQPSHLDTAIDAAMSPPLASDGGEQP